MKFNTIESLQEQIEKVKARIVELEDCENEGEYDDMIDETNGDVVICGMKYLSSRALKELDPIAYRCGHTDFNDSLLTDANDELESLESDLKDEQEAEKEEKGGK